MQSERCKVKIILHFDFSFQTFFHANIEMNNVTNTTVKGFYCKNY